MVYSFYNQDAGPQNKGQCLENVDANAAARSRIALLSDDPTAFDGDTKGADASCQSLGFSNYAGSMPTIYGDSFKIFNK